MKNTEELQKGAARFFLRKSPINEGGCIDVY